jgi:hypothetical protein
MITTRAPEAKNKLKRDAFNEIHAFNEPIFHPAEGKIDVWYIGLTNYLDSKMTHVAIPYSIIGWSYSERITCQFGIVLSKRYQNNTIAERATRRAACCVLWLYATQDPRVNMIDSQSRLRHMQDASSITQETSIQIVQRYDGMI